MQSLMQDIYELDIQHNIYDYLITSSTLADHLSDGNSERQPREQLFIAEQSDELGLSLYLDREVVRNLHENNPLEELGQHNLQDCCLALEGISHFLYVIWNASHDRPVTQLELELQAEIDKFITLASVTGKLGLSHLGELADVLFSGCGYDENLTAEESRRYRLANDMAARYCKQLQDSYINRGKTAELTRELRRFYRMRQDNKLRWISLSS